MSRHDWKDWVVVADKPEKTFAETYAPTPGAPDYIDVWNDWLRSCHGLHVTTTDRQYFQGLRETAKDPAMVAYYENVLRRYVP